MGRWGLLARFFYGMAVGIAAVALIMGCAAAAHEHAQEAGVLAAGQERGSWASAGEVAWLHRLGVWETSLMRSLDRAAHAASDANAELFVGPIRFCSHNLERQVGNPPTARLQPAADTLEQACAHLERAVDSKSADVAEQEGRRGGDFLLRADQMLPPGETRSLPVVAGAATESRIDPKFSRIASDLAGKNVEIRCWSRVDWTRLLREEKAYTVHHIDDETLGFAGINGTRDNLAPQVCDGLEDLAYEHRTPTAAGAKLLLASAIATLSHEPQHTRGIAVEAQAECYAIQLMKRTAVQLGATPAYAASLQQAYWRRYDLELPTYRSPECREGGAYDLNKLDPSFP